jgi:hypothetical protein
MTEARTLPLPYESEPAREPFIGDVRLDLRQLVQEFHFDLNGYEPLSPAEIVGCPPNEVLGWVDSTTKLPPISLAGKPLPEGIEVWEKRVVDPYLYCDDAYFNGEGYKIVSDRAEHIENIMKSMSYDPYKHRSEAMGPESFNIFTRAWLAHPSMEAGRIWHSLIPSAEALYWTYNPINRRNVIDAGPSGLGEKTTISDEVVAQWEFLDDPVAVRNRGVAYIDLALEHAAEMLNKGLITPEDFKILSLGSGAGEKTIQVAKFLESTMGVKPDVVLADMSERALKNAKINAKINGLPQEQLTTVKANVFSHSLVKYLERETREKQQLYPIEDNLGIADYLRQPGDELPTRIERKLPPPNEFIKIGFDRLMPGGAMFVSNLILEGAMNPPSETPTRPQLDFFTGVIAWRDTSLRSEESFLKMFDDIRHLADISLYRVVDAITGKLIYVIAKVIKKEGVE